MPYQGHSASSTSIFFSLSKQLPGFLFSLSMSHIISVNSFANNLFIKIEAHFNIHFSPVAIAFLWRQLFLRILGMISFNCCSLLSDDSFFGIYPPSKAKKSYLLSFIFIFQQNIVNIFISIVPFCTIYDTMLLFASHCNIVNHTKVDFTIYKKEANSRLNYIILTK